MSRAELKDKYIETTMKIHYLEDQIRDGDNDISTLKRLQSLKREQKEIDKRLDNANKGISVSNLKGDIILLEITKHVGHDVLRQNKHKKNEIIFRYNSIRNKLDKAITYRNLVRR